MPRADNAPVTLFDLDNTLIPFLGPIRRWADTWAEHARPEDADVVREVLLDVALEETEDPQRAVRVVADRFDLGDVAQTATEHAREVYWRTLTPYPGVRGTLARLVRAQVPLGIVTDAPRPRAATRLEATQLTDFFDVVVTRDDTPHGNGKATARPFQIALEALDADPHEAIMVGDWPAFDIRWPNRIGMRSVLATWGSGALPDQAHCDAEPTLEADDPRQVADLVLDHPTPTTASPPLRQTNLA